MWFRLGGTNVARGGARVFICVRRSIDERYGPHRRTTDMAEFPAHDRTLGSGPARNLANTTKTPPQWRGTTPRWLVSLLPWTPVADGGCSVDRVKHETEEEGPSTRSH